jgi:phosphoribosylaminoimidazolecarboxamide formyltransferase/IMP cyclohydrolase
MKNALLSVSDKTGLVELGRFLLRNDFCLVSTGGTYQKLIDELPEAGKQGRIKNLSEEVTRFPEILGGRVKTLHPRIYGGILARRDDPKHVSEMNDLGLEHFDLVCVNLYPFHKAVDSHLKMKETQELIDIGGVSLLRAAAKNYQDVIVLSDISSYQPFMFMYNILKEDPVAGENIRRQLAVKAFDKTCQYDEQISKYLQTFDGNGVKDCKNNTITRKYLKDITLKYGCNPHQDQANTFNILTDLSNTGTDNGVFSKPGPFKILNGTPGYINMLDAINSWQLVSEAKNLLLGDVEFGAVVASFKHTSPAGVAIRGSLAEAYRTARDSDPMSSFGDFVALSEVCDVETAKLIKPEVSDGVVAPGYSDEALEILKTKKGGKYLILLANPNYQNEQEYEYRETYGVALMQKVNHRSVKVGEGQIVTTNQDLSMDIERDMVLANITMKYSQSNNVVMAYQGQVVAIAAGQQSRVDCVKLACRKVKVWWGRKHSKVLALDDLYRKDIKIKRNDKINCAVRYVEGDFTKIEYRDWCDKFTCVPQPFDDFDKAHHLSTLEGVVMASDAFFPFRDNIDHASKVGVKYIIQPGGSVADQGVIDACNQYNMVMKCTGVRVFTH